VNSYARLEGDAPSASRFTRQRSDGAKPSRSFPRGLRFVLALVFIALCTACRRAPDSHTHIRIWHQKIGGERDLFNEFVRQYNAAHPDRVVETL